MGYVEIVEPKTDVGLFFKDGVAAKKMRKYAKRRGLPTKYRWWGETKFKDENNLDELNQLAAIVVSNDDYGNEVLKELREKQASGQLDSDIPLMRYDGKVVVVVPQ